MIRGIAPSILASDFSRLGDQIAEAERAGAAAIHVDVMDGRFVPNLTMGQVVVTACRRSTTLPLDVHLMIVEPERYVTSFAEAGANIVTVHAEATSHLHRTVQLIREAGARPGVAVNPLTPLSVYRDALPHIDLALLMTVNPGFGGQAFIASSLQRLERLRVLRDELNPECIIEVDGGIAAGNAGDVSRAGADLLVAGTSVFGSSDTVAGNLAALQRAVAAGD